MRKKSETRAKAGCDLRNGSQLELVLALRDPGPAASIVQFPRQQKRQVAYSDAKRRLLEFAARLPD